MTVSELIAQLKNVPGDREVVMAHNEGGYYYCTSVDEIKIAVNWWDGGAWRGNHEAAHSAYKKDEEKIEIIKVIVIN